MKIVLLVIMIFVSLLAAIAGEVPNQCKVTYGDSAIGSFTATTGEEKLTTLSFPIPGAELLAIAQVYYTDEFIRLDVSDNALLDESVTIRLEIAEKAPPKPGLRLSGKGTVTRAIFGDFAGINMLELCKKALSDSAYAAKVAPNSRMKEILKVSCSSYVANEGRNTIGVSKDLKNKKVELTCTE
jgi:hypothetical protein